MMPRSNTGKTLLECTSFLDVIGVRKLFALGVAQQAVGYTVEVIEDHHSGVEKTSVLIIDGFAAALIGTVRDTVESRELTLLDICLYALGLVSWGVWANLATADVLAIEGVDTVTERINHAVIRLEATVGCFRLETISLNVASNERGQDT